jgi:hypothetical protein
MALIIDPKTRQRIYELLCHCGHKGGEVRFPEKHGRETDKALERECDATYTHRCPDHDPRE